MQGLPESHAARCCPSTKQCSLAIQPGPLHGSARSALASNDASLVVEVRSSGQIQVLQAHCAQHLLRQLVLHAQFAGQCTRSWRTECTRCCRSSDSGVLAAILE